MRVLLMIAETIAAELHRQGRTQAWLARESRVPTSNLGEFLRGKRELRSASVERICRALGLQLKNCPS